MHVYEALVKGRVHGAVEVLEERFRALLAKATDG